MSKKAENDTYSDVDFDNSYTLLYKNVITLESPANYIIFENNTYTRLQDIINIEPRVPIYKLYNQYKEKYFFKDFLYAYFYFAYEYVETEKLFAMINNAVEQYNEDLKLADPDTKKIFPEYESLDALVQAVTLWQKNYQSLYNKDVQILKKILRVQDKLKIVEPVKIEQRQIDKVSYEYTPQINLETKKVKGKFQPVKVNHRIGILMFEEMKASAYVPFIQLNNYDLQKYYKVYESETFRQISNIIKQDTVSDKPNTIYFKILVTDEIETTKNSSYEDVIYYLDTNKLIFKTNYNNKAIIIRRLQDCFRGFKFSAKNSREYNISGQAVIKNFTFSDAVFHFIILNENEIDEIENKYGGLINTYLFIDESKKAISEKSFITIKYKSLIEEDIDEESVGNPSSAKIKLNQENDNLVLNFEKVANYEVLDQFLEIFTRVLTIYKEFEPDILSFLDSIVTISETFSTKKGRKTKIIQDVYDRKISQLRGESPDPEIFKPGSDAYSRRCDCKKQPIIIEEDEAKDWENKTFSDKNIIMKRQIGKFPKNNPKLLYVCPSDIYPYPAMIENNDPSNLKEYPFIPCCAMTDNINKSSSKYNTTIESTPGKIQKPKKAASNYKVTTIKQIDYGRPAEIPIELQQILDDKIKYERYGSGRSINSILRCIFIATNYREYLNISSEDEKEKYCKNFRKNIISLLPNFYEVAKQEMFDYTKENVEYYLTDNNEFLDTFLSFRVLEEIFDINIFVFIPKDTNIMKTADNGFEIARHAISHIRPYNVKRKSILVFKHMGGEMNSLEYPQYDLIVNTNMLFDNIKENNQSETQGITFIFDENITNTLYNAISQYNTSYIFEYENENIVARKAPYSYLKFKDIFDSFNIDSQDIDSYGKTRSLNISSKVYKNVNITVMVPPSQPLNVPYSDVIHKTTENIVKSIFGKPSEETEDGLWYKILDYKYGIFIPCKTSSMNVNHQNPLGVKFLSTENPISEFRQIKKYSQMLLDFIIWGLRSNGILNLKDFNENVDKYIIMNENVRPNIVPNELISYITENGNFAYFVNIWPEYFYKNNTVQLYPTLYEKIMGYLEKYYSETDGLSLAPNPYLTGIFEYEWDFKKYENNRILIGVDHLKTWVDIHSKNYKGELNIQNELKTEMFGNIVEPIIYRQNTRMYLIQNVVDGNFNKALKCGKIWLDYKFNIGFEELEIKFYDFEENKRYIPHLIYSISGSNELIVTSNNDDKTNGEEKYVSLIRFTDNSYSVLLELC
jgi:hypothetical protein